MSTTTTTTIAKTKAANPTIDALLAAIVGGTGGSVAELYAPDAVVDATVPEWRFHVRGNRAIASQMANWFATAGSFDELDRRLTAEGEVVTYFLSWLEGGVPHAARHCHVLTLGADGRITNEQFFCGGRWNATLLAAMEEADRA
ncbi:MAG TPA: nuclear transport factor 2 family protein [Acidimicrobiales bacterium]|nr:nuclear transport factor 2 family protein [Acidimicrobiales bacterium]